MPALSRLRVSWRWPHRDDGASAVEYALLVAGIAAVVVVIVFALGSVLHSSVHKSCSTIETQFDGGTSQCDTGQ